MTIRTTHWLTVAMLALAALFMAATPLFADEAPAAVTAEATPAASPAVETPAVVVEVVEAAAESPTNTLADLVKQTGDIKLAVDTVWVLVAGMLVFFMNAGFALVESGLCRAKNCVNILGKNFVVFGCASLAFYVMGWGLMFGNGVEGSTLGKFVGQTGLWFANGGDEAYTSIGWAPVPHWAKFFFQLVFAGTAATIVSGAVAERIKFGSFIIFSFIICGVIYPIVGHMIWGGGYLAQSGMFDFAGSTVVHSAGGWAALAGVIVLGPRTGKYGPNGKINAIPGHNMTSVTLGGLILWLGWFGFNPGSTMGAVGYADAIGHIAVTTNTAAAAATISAALTAWLVLGKPDLSMIINGTLAGLVGITASCAFVSVPSSLIIGLLAGVLVVFAVLAFDKLKLDDPVGALSVHLVNGIFGTLCVGLFSEKGICSAATAEDGLFFGGGTKQLIPQLVGIALVAVVAFGLSLVAWYALKFTLGIRVSQAEELQGLDIGEHGQTAYPDFQANILHGDTIKQAM